MTSTSPLNRAAPDSDRYSDAIGQAFTAAEPFIRLVSKWPQVCTPAYVVVVLLADQTLGELVVSDLPRDQWPAPFADVARGKAALTARTGLPSRTVLQDRQDLLQPGDPRWFGSALEPASGLVVAASGGPEDVDELISRMVLELIRVPAILHAREEILARGPEHTTFDLI
jgi:hypothetical protein